MKILILGGTRFFGKHLVEKLVEKRYQVTIATRGSTPDSFGHRLRRIRVERNDLESMKQAFSNQIFDIVYDNLAYCSNAVKYALDTVRTDYYVMTSSASVYNPPNPGVMEEDFSAEAYPFVWCDRDSGAYPEGKRMAEAALAQNYAQAKQCAVRFPVVLGKDDYTERLRFYVSHTVRQIPMQINNPAAKMCFISSAEAAEFLAGLAEKKIFGAVNACSVGEISLQEIVRYVGNKTGRKAILSEKGEPAPYNGTPEYWLNTEKAQSAGFSFSHLNDWIFELLDSYIQEEMEK